MPRTAQTNAVRDTREPLEIYNSLPHHKQLVCYRYWSWINSSGETGWNKDHAGSVFHYRSSQYLLSSFVSQSSFRHCAKQMVTLAERLAQLHTPPTAPEVPQVNIELPQHQTRTTTPPPAPPAMPTLNSPNPGTPLRNVRIGTPGSATRAADSNSNPSIPPVTFGDDNRDDATFPTLPVPVAYGRYRHFDYTNRRATDRMLIRMLVHGAVQTVDVSFEFLTKKVLEVKVAWPQWFVFAEQMAMLTADDEGNIAFPPEHAMTMDMSERNAEMMEEDGNVYDYGYFRFANDMVQTIDTFELLNIPIDDSGITVRMLQFYVEVSRNNPLQRHQRVTHTRTANLGTGRTDPGPSNARTSSERDAGDTNETNDDGTGDSNMPDSNETGTTGNFATFINRNVLGRMN
jgi:hypothetical protein